MADSLPYTRSAAATRKGTTHPINEDAYRVLDAASAAVKRARRGVLFAVADGVSSTNQGQYAAQTTSTRLEHFFEDAHPPETQALRNLLLEIDTELSGGGRGRAACTLSALWLFAGRATVLHVGNSEVLRMREGDLQSVTPEAGQGSRRLLRNFVGMGRLDQVLHTGEDEFQPGDIYFLFTDGVREAMPTNGAIASAWVRAGQDPERFVARVVGEAEAQSVEDDATVVVVQVVGLETIRLAVNKLRVR